MPPPQKWVRRKRSAEERLSGKWDDDKGISGWLLFGLVLSVLASVGLAVMKPEPKPRQPLPRAVVALGHDSFPCAETLKMGSALVCSLGKEQFDGYGDYEQRQRAEKTLQDVEDDGFSQLVVIAREDGRRLGLFR